MERINTKHCFVGVEMLVSFASLILWNIRPEGEYGFWGFLTIGAFSQRVNAGLSFGADFLFQKRKGAKGRGRDLNPG